MFVEIRSWLQSLISRLPRVFVVKVFVIRHHSAVFVPNGWAANQPNDRDLDRTESKSSRCVVCRIETLLSRRTEYPDNV